MEPIQALALINNMKKFLFLITLLGFSIAVPVHGQTLLDDINQQNQAFAGDKGAQLKDVDPRILTAQVIKTLLTVTGTLLVVWTFYGGFLIFTSAGDTDKIDHAKSIITNCVIGLVIVLSSYSIAGLVYRLWADAQKTPVVGQPNDNPFKFWVDKNTDNFTNGDRMGGNTDHTNYK